MKQAAVIVLALVSILAGAAVPAAADPAAQAAEGHVLIYRKNCAACHDGLAAGAAGPSLRTVRMRLSPSNLRRFAAAPRSLKPGARMPHLFPAAAGDDESLQALTAFLMQGTIESVPPPPGTVNPDRGRELYHQVGCVACHQPDEGPELPGSVPINLARHYHRDGLIAYLRSPGTALMPSLKLTAEEARDLAAWLQREADSPDEIPHVAPGSPALIAEGRRQFSARRCASCHEGPDLQPLPVPARLPIKNWSDGCLSTSPQPPAADFGLSAQERAAIRSAAGSPRPTTPQATVDHLLRAHRCHACHQRDGTGGPGVERRAFFGVTDQMAESYGDFGSIPPKLDHVGRRLTHAWLHKVLVDGGGEVRPYLATRMPHYALPEAEWSRFLQALEEADRRDPPVEIDVSGLPRHQRGHYGRDLMGSNGLNCVTCHGLKGQRALGAPVIDLTHTVERLRPGWFKEVLLDPQSVQPGTLMPPLFLTRPKADQEVEQIWTYLKELDQRRLPDGLLRRGDFELKPSEAGRPIVFRTFLEGVGTHAVAVGFPDGHNVAFDTRAATWILAWKGPFLDALSTWDDRYATPAKPLGKEIHRFAPPPDQERRRFNGFRLDSGGTPTFLYTVGNQPVEDTIRSLPSGELERVVTRDGTTLRQRVVMRQGTARFQNDD